MKAVNLYEKIDTDSANEEAISEAVSRLNVALAELDNLVRVFPPILVPSGEHANVLVQTVEYEGDIGHA